MGLKQAGTGRASAHDACLVKSLLTYAEIWGKRLPIRNPALGRNGQTSAVFSHGNSVTSAAKLRWSLTLQIGHQLSALLAAERKVLPQKEMTAAIVTNELYYGCYELRYLNI